ncbi:MAG: flagellar biosynthesis protein FlhG [Planctomycetota bacterium]|jgi:flagellar biosynthesis protein FlhG
MNFVMVTGGKGGVGKTTLAANLGVALAQRGMRILLVDLDFSLANLNVMFGLTPRHTLEEFFRDNHPLSDCIIKGPGGVHLLPGSSGSSELSRDDLERRQRLANGLTELATNYDLVIGDSAAGIGADVLFFSALAELVLVVTTPEPAALTDAFGLVKALDAEVLSGAAEIPTPELFLNLVHGSDQAERLSSRLREVCERFLARSPRLSGWLPRSSGVLQSSMSQRPFIGNRAQKQALETRCVLNLAKRLERRFREVPVSTGL